MKTSGQIIGIIVDHMDAYAAQDNLDAAKARGVLQKLLDEIMNDDEQPKD